MKRYHAVYAALVGLVMVTDLTAASTGGVDTFMATQLCGPVIMWVLALFLPAETIQTRLMNALNSDST